MGRHFRGRIAHTVRPSTKRFTHPSMRLRVACGRSAARGVRGCVDTIVLERGIESYTSGMEARDKDVYRELITL